MTKVKICGITREEDAIAAAELGAAAIGLNFYPPSPRYLTIERARALVSVIPAHVQTFGVFVDMPASQIREIVEQTGIRGVQLHGSEPPETVAELAPLPVLRAFTWKDRSSEQAIADYLAACAQAGALPVGALLDTHRKGSPGGTGQAWDWAEAAGLSLAIPLFLAGGLRAGNVVAAIAALRPLAVDVAGGVESEPGVKDRAKMKAFFNAVKAADRQTVSPDQ